QAEGLIDVVVVTVGGPAATVVTIGTDARGIHFLQTKPPVGSAAGADAATQTEAAAEHAVDRATHRQRATEMRVSGARERHEQRVLALRGEHSLREDHGASSPAGPGGKIRGLLEITIEVRRE